jgi:L-malate glycosyltransferase
VRILHLVSSHRWTGAAEPSFGLAREQHRLGHDVHFACARETDATWFADVVRRSELTWAEGLDLRPRVSWRIFRADIASLRALIARHHYDVVHCHLSHAHWIAALALRRLTDGAAQPLLVRTFHRDVAPSTDPLHRWLYLRATDLLIVLSRSAEARDAAKLGLHDPRRLRWIPGAVDTDLFRAGIDPQINRALWGIPADAPVAGMPSEMQPHRGHFEFLATLDEVARRVPDVRYLLLGAGGEWKDRVVQTVAAHPLGERIVNAGIRHDDLPEIHAATTVAVVLAQGSDGSCRAVLEAMACARPVIGANIGAIADAIEDGRTGWLIDRAKPAELMNALVEALGNPGRTAEMGAAARRTIEARYTQRVRADAVLEAYRLAADHKLQRRAPAP